MAKYDEGVVVVEEVKRATEFGTSDGETVWSRNNMRLMRSKPGMFSDSRELEALALELSGAAHELSIPYVIRLGDGAPTAFYFNSKKAALSQLWNELTLTRAAENSGRSLLPNIPLDNAGVLALIEVSQENRTRVENLQQHISDPNNPSKVIANPEWLDARVLRFTASKSSTYLAAPAKVLDATACRDWFAAAPAIAVATGTNTYAGASRPVATAIFDKPFHGNKYTELGNRKEDEYMDKGTEKIGDVFGLKLTVRHSGAYFGEGSDAFIMASLDGESKELYFSCW